jgi:hypothetical protein
LVGAVLLIIIVILMYRCHRKRQERLNGGFLGEALVDHAAYLLPDPTGNKIRAEDVFKETDVAKSDDMSIFSFLRNNSTEV